MPPDTANPAPSRVQSALAADRLGTHSIVYFILTAATPMTVVAGVVTTGFATTGLTGVPIAFIGVGLVLALFAPGYLAMARRVTNAGAFYAYIARIGRPLGVGGSWIAFAAYNSLQVGLYGLLGASAAPLLVNWFGIDIPWWVLGGLCWLVVAVLGVQAIDVSGKVLAVLVSAEILAIVVMSASNLAHPADGLDLTSLSPGNLVGTGAGAILVMALLGFVGFEASTVYSEESKDPRRTVPMATYVSLAILAIMYTGASWALTVAVGSDQIVSVSGTEGVETIFNLANAQLGGTVAEIGHVLLVTSVIAAALSFHNTSARYAFALGREGVLPSALGRTSMRTGSPWAASLLQSGIGLVVLAVFAIGDLDPMNALFFPAGTSGGLAVLMLITLTSIAVVVFFARNRDGETTWSARVAPVIATVVLLAVLYAAITNFDLVLGVPPDSVLPWLIPVILVLIGLAGVGWGLILRRIRPEVYEHIGAGADTAVLSAGTGPINTEGIR